jgi:O-antigen ligase
MYEIGPIPGFFFMLFRFLLALFVVVKAVAQARHHQPLALLLVPLMFTSLSLTLMSQPTAQGFTVVSVAFSLAALKQTDKLSVRVPQRSRFRYSNFRGAQGVR